MVSTRMRKGFSSSGSRAMAGIFVASALCVSCLASAQYPNQDRNQYPNQDRNQYPSQDRNQYPNQDRDRDRITTLVPGTVIPVRTNEAIDVRKGDYRVYTGIVDQDVRGNDGHLAIPRGSSVELIVRFNNNNDMFLDLDSVTANGQRYAVKTDPKRVESLQDNSLVGGIIGAISGAEVRGQAVRVPRDTVVTFRLQRPLDMGIADRGVTREGRHYHDYERDWYGGRDSNR
jgi:hypothetical protein